MATLPAVRYSRWLFLPTRDSIGRLLELPCPDCDIVMVRQWNERPFLFELKSAE